MESQPKNPPAHLVQTRERLDRLSWWLDQSFTLPGTRFKFGLDALIGLVPVAGDVVGFALSLWVMRQAHQCGAPRKLLYKMGGNALLDAVSGFVPVVGDVFDFFFKANRRNAALLREHLDQELRPYSPPLQQKRMLLIAVLIGIAGFLGFSTLL